MKISIEKYSSDWERVFLAIKSELQELIGFSDPTIEHIGSTAVEGLSAKPIIDILIGVNNVSDLEKIIKPLIDNNYVYYQKYNINMPYRRFFVKHKVNPENLPVPSIITDKDRPPSNTIEHNSRIAHIHVMPVNSGHFLRHIAFRELLRTHPSVRVQYQRLKERLSIKEWEDGNEYNKAKDKFLKTAGQKAITWYSSKL